MKQFGLFNPVVNPNIKVRRKYEVYRFLVERTRIKLNEKVVTEVLGNFYFKTSFQQTYYKGYF